MGFGLAEAARLEVTAAFAGGICFCGCNLFSVSSPVPAGQVAHQLAVLQRKADGPAGSCRKSPKKKLPGFSAEVTGDAGGRVPGI